MGEKYPLCTNGTTIENATEYEGLCVFNTLSAAEIEVPDLTAVDDSQPFAGVSKPMDDGKYNTSKLVYNWIQYCPFIVMYISVYLTHCCIMFIFRRSHHSRFTRPN